MSRILRSIFHFFLSKENLLAFSLAAGLLCAFLVAARSHPQRQDISPARPDEPRISFDPPSADLGVILQAQTLRRVFRLVNSSTNQVRLLGLRPSCGCTVVKEELRGAVIPPYGSLGVPVEFHSEFRQPHAHKPVNGEQALRRPLYLQRNACAGELEDHDM
ncbi:DUF1573 domain-containing protein [Patescibacteria group bacterium]|nr:DUF1573 domain-containing protein [Patescibacteria group bacterium]